MGKRNVQRLIERAWKTGETFDLLSSDSLKLQPVADDTGKIQIGDGTKDMDFQIFVGSATESFLFDVGNSKLTATAPIESNSAINTSGTMALSGAVTFSSTVSLTGVMTVSGNGQVTDKIVTKNAAAIVVNASHYGATVLATKADGATTFQLPTPAAGLAGYKTRVVQQANQNLVVNCATANKIVALNSVAYNTVTFSTANEKIGAGAMCICDGAKWQVIPDQGTATLA
jgi:hypothetical protein